MNRNRSAVLVTILSVLIGVAMLTQVGITPTPAQTAAPKVTGKITDTVVKSFDAAGLPGIHSIQYRHQVYSPGAKIEGTVAFVMSDHARLCEPRKGKLTATLEDGSKVVFTPGAFLTVPLGVRTKLLVADAEAGFEQFYWSINISGRK